MNHRASPQTLLTFGDFQHAAARRNHALLERHRERDTPYTVDFAGHRVSVDPNVFCPTIGEGSQLVAESIGGRTPGRVLDMGTGSGALAIVAARDSERIVATDISPLAVSCAQGNVQRLGLAGRIEVRRGDLFAPLVDDERFDLVLFNPPFLEGHPHDDLEASVFDENYNVLRRFFLGVARHLTADGRILLAFGDVGSVSYLNYLIRESGFAPKRVASRSSGALDFFVLELTPRT